MPKKQVTCEKITYISRLVRKEIEDWTFSVGRSWFDSDTLCGACGVASWTLKNALSHLKISSDFVMGTFNQYGNHNPDEDENHCWIVIDDMIVDITATQFGIHFPVFVTSVDDSKYCQRYKNIHAYRRLATWEGQSHSWYRPTLEEIAKKVAQEAHE